ncbi:AMP-dependent synthetase and ligase [Guyanagaster necrorhizus]|uniref:AMP-dependent synthetase and ligase n=1 Tax=Guyanagaster necrorhizus TaxID=856835 RepID=A0A9P8ASR8_9AGAR|nr:AMP-dependent synthetase and ligase [Guyanagaster necrorhizus MCA 3950]KAG7445147.1 AMP-dependent synthetase and ligase [Guyanagaster necrorhizus MCA 3950]
MIALPTGPENALALLSLATYHTVAPINASCTASELREDAHRLNAKAIVSTKEAGHRLELLALQDALDCEIVYIEGYPTGPAGLFHMTLVGGNMVIPPPSTPHGLRDQSLVLHTSGTSGKKKVVPYTLRSLIVGTWAVVHSWDLQPRDVNLNMMPLFHVGGIIRNLWAPAFSGGSAIMCAGFDAIAFWNLASQLHATWYYAAPTIHHAVLTSQPDYIDPDRDISIRMICNAAGGLLPSLAVELQNRFTKATILPSYGMTECMPIASPPTTYRLERPGCSGIACGPYISIRDPYDSECEFPTGKTGAVSVRGLPTFEGYEISPDINMPLDTSAFSSEGWFDTGDVGYVDSDGYLFITGRSKEIINKGGEVISPFEIEEAIMTAARDHVKASLAFAIDHNALQEAIGVVIVPIPNRPRVGLSQLHDLLKDHLHPSKWPFAIVYMADLPKNSAGKPLRIKLATRFGLGCMTDSVPVVQRHFEAEVPPPLAALSEPIACSNVSVDLAELKITLLSTHGVSDVAVRFRHDGNPEAFVSLISQDAPGEDALMEYISGILPGYILPDPLRVLRTPLLKSTDGQVDFSTMEEEFARQNASTMTPRELLVRDIISDLLSIESDRIKRDSDFFLLGGNSLLLGKLSYFVRKATGAAIPISAIFANSTVSGIAKLIQIQQEHTPSNSTSMMTLPYKRLPDTPSDSTLSYGEQDSTKSPKGFRGQSHPLSILLQSFPFIFFYPLKTALTWTLLLYIMSHLARYIDNSYWERMGVLLCCIVAARLATRVVAPVVAIAFKWIVIGRYKPGTYKMWSPYYLRWWIVNQSLRTAGRGIFALHPALEKLYFRLLGARIGKNVRIAHKAKLGEYDLISLEDGCRLDTALIRGFCVERDGQFRLDHIVIGKNAVVNTYTQVAPGARIPDGAVYGPHSSSNEAPSPSAYAALNRTSFRGPHWFLKVFVAYPIFGLVLFISYLPWFASIYLMLEETVFIRPHGNALVAVIFWFATSKRVLYHAISRIIRAVFTPLIHLVVSIIVKRIFGLNRPCRDEDVSQLVLLRRYINSVLLSQDRLRDAFSILGTHYEAVSIAYRAMGAKIGRRIYWPGSGMYCLEPELLEIGNDVVFGSRSEVFTTDTISSERIVIGDGAMIADRVILLPGVRVGRRAVLGSGTMTTRDAYYEERSTWMGSDRGQAICFSKGSKDPDPTSDTTTPFGKAFYRRQADYFVLPYSILLLINVFAASCSAAFWSISAVATAQVLRQLHIHFPEVHFFSPVWYRVVVLYGLIAIGFAVVLNLQALAVILWVIVTKWIIIGRRNVGKYEWDKSSYCQRWQLHLVLSRPLYKGYGNGGILLPMTGTVFIVWYLRALGAKIGKNCAIYVGGKAGLMTEPDLVELGDDVSLDNCSVVAHINSRGNFALNGLKIGTGCAMRSGSRLLSGASMEDSSMLCEHTLLTSGEVAESGAVYVGWPARRVDHSKSWRGSKERTEVR